MRYLILLCAFMYPITSSAALLFSEIAWMGNDEDSNNEWIELYNFGDVAADVTGWTVTDGGSIRITLTGTIAPHGVALLERTDDSSVPGVTALVTYTGALPNGGTTLTLTAPDGVVSDQAIGGTDWGLIGGSNTVPKKTAQRTRTGSWVTAAPTPGAENAQVSDTNEDDNTDEEDGDTNTGAEQNTTETRRSSSNTNKRTPIVESTAELTLRMSAPDIVYVNQPVDFMVSATGTGRSIVNSLVYTWNFGDTHAGEGKTPRHTYVYPGEYLVVVNAKFGKHDVTIEKVLKVLAVGVALSRTEEGDIQLTNTAPQEIDISGYTLSGTETLVLPPHTRLLKGGSVTIAKERVVPGGFGMIALYDRDKSMLANEVQVTHIARSVVPTGTQFLALSQPMTSSGQIAIPTPKQLVSLRSTTEVNPVEGEVAGTSTLFSGLTIPVYAADNAAVTKKEDAPILPYVGLALVLGAALILLYRRPQGDSL